MQSTVPGIRSVRLYGEPERKIPTGIADPKRPTVAKDLLRASEYFQRACQLGDGDGCRESAVSLQESAASPGDPARARANEIFARQCHRSDSSSCLYLVRNATAAGGSIAGKSAAYWQAHACLFGGDSYCIDPASNPAPAP